MEEDQANHALALDVLLEYGFADKCEVHEEYSDSGAGDPAEDTDQLPDMIEALRRAGFEGTDDEATTALSAALGDTGDECGLCAKNRDS